MKISHLELEGAEGVRLHGAAAGERGPLILFLHGFPEFWEAWHRQLIEFGRDYRAVALDLRGYNLSGKPKGVRAYALPKLVDDICHVLHALSPREPAIVVGHDWGGIIGWSLARERPELLDRLVIINAPHPAIFLRELKQNRGQLFASSYAAFFQLRGIAETVLRAFDYAALRKMVFGLSSKPQVFTRTLRARYREAWGQPRALPASLHYYRNIRALRRAAASKETWRINVPTLVLWGDQDPALVGANLVGLDQFVPRLTLLRHPSATHWIVHEEPEWVNAAIRTFIES